MATAATSGRSRSPSPTPSKLPPIPASPTYSYASTANPLSAFNLPLPPPPRPPHAVLSKPDLEQSQAAYSDLLATAKAYRVALASLSSAASAFGSAVEACARLKEARSEPLSPSGGSLLNGFTGSCTADSLMAASGLHQLIANHQQILSETVYRSFEVPLLHELDGWQRGLEEEEVSYQRQVKALSKEIRRMEKEGLKLHRQRRRDVGKFRNHLVDLTAKLDGLTTLHGTHARSLLGGSQEMSVKIVEASSSLVRAEVDIFEALARKGWSGGGLEDLLEKGVDLFANEQEIIEDDGNALFSILPNKSILSTENADGAGQTRIPHTRHDSLGMDGDRYQSLAGAMIGADPEDDRRSIMSEGSMFNKSRGVRPFSPPPLSQMPEEDVEASADASDDKVSSSAPLVRNPGFEVGSVQTVIQVPVGADRGKSPVEPDTVVEDEHEGDDESEVHLHADDDDETSGRPHGRERRWSVTDDERSD